jgi:hypothetical protein
MIAPIKQGAKKLLKKLNERFGFNLTTRYKHYHVKVLMATQHEHLNFIGAEFDIWACNEKEAVNSPEIKSCVIEFTCKGYAVRIDVSRHVTNFRPAKAV